MTELNTIQYWVAQYKANLTHCACYCYTCQNCYRTMQMWYKFQVIFLPDEAYWTSFVLKSSLENSETWTGTNIDKVCTLQCVVLSVQSIMHCQQRQQSDLPKIAPRRYLSLVNQCVLILLIVFFPVKPWIETKYQDLHIGSFIWPIWACTLWMATRNTYFVKWKPSYLLLLDLFNAGILTCSWLHWWQGKNWSLPEQVSKSTRLHHDQVEELQRLGFLLLFYST